MIAELFMLAMLVVADGASRGLRLLSGLHLLSCVCCSLGRQAAIVLI